MQGITKTFTISGTKGVSARVTVTEEYDITANTSVLTVGVAVACSSYYGQTYYLNGTVSAAGQTLQSMSSQSGTHHVTVSKLDTYYSIAGNGHPGSPWTTAAITHDTDGSKTVTVAVDFKGYEPSGKGASGFTVSGSKSVTLTQIPRASTVGAADANIGSAAIIAVSRKSTDYTHSIAYSFGNLSGYLTADGAMTNTETKLTATGIAFPLPESFYYEIPGSPSGRCTLTCTTYLGDTRIGDKQSCTFTVTAAQNLCAPEVSGQVEDVNAATTALTGSSSVLVRYASQAKCTITAAARFGASITSKTVGSTAVSENSVTLPAADSYVFTATDSRGYKSGVTVTPSVVPYVILTCNPAAKRNDPTSGNVTLTVSGECYHGSFGAAENELELRCRVGEGNWINMTPVFKNHTYTATAALTDLAYDSRHTITVEAADKLASVTRSVTVDKGIPVFDWGEEDFVFHVPVHMQGGEGSGYVPPTRTVNGLALSGNIALTAADVGAAPGGFGLGMNGAWIDSVESITKSGFYMCRGDTPTTAWWLCYAIVAEEGKYVTVDAWQIDGTNNCKRTKTGGTWSEWEWVDPPMVASTEYRTTERYLGKPVYVKLISCGALPNATTKTVAHGISGTVIGFQGFATNSDGLVQQMPLVATNLSISAKLHVTTTHVTLVTTSNMSAYSATVIIRYTK